GIVSSDGTILANEKKVFVPLQGGIHPREAAESHAKDAYSVILQALKKSNLQMSNINVIAFSQSPGLGPCLRIGAIISRYLSKQLDIPLYGVNHCIAHVEIGRLLFNLKLADVLTLYVSGGNTLVCAYDQGRYRVFGETLDISIGNLLDVFARAAGLSHPGGPKIEKLAKNGQNLIDLPYTVKGMDLSYSGLLTASINKFKEGIRLEDMCFSLQEIAFSMLTEVTERALAHTEKKFVLLTGGVAANKKLEQMIRLISEEHNAVFNAVPQHLAADNGVMIAWTGLLHARKEKPLSIKESIVKPNLRIDEIIVTWDD
ncbi:MAG TPA: KEOPS complex N(6)-L-threonylcarbamoyladenine synthase Kae1, partial [Candidatus Deferrimicrobium sp.]|nr:KEOPS complex N(6)-L-threonylcarbamoyladenine synthase Kae1 [Candidatus Deferrimicrobium sp.]